MTARECLRVLRESEALHDAQLEQLILGQPLPDKVRSSIIAKVESLAQVWPEQSIPKLNRRAAQLLNRVCSNGPRAALPSSVAFIARHAASILGDELVVSEIQFLRTEDWAELAVRNQKPELAWLDMLQRAGASTTVLLRAAVGLSGALNSLGWLHPRWEALDPTGHELDDFEDVLASVYTSVQGLNVGTWQRWITRWATSEKSRLVSLPATMLGRCVDAELAGKLIAALGLDGLARLSRKSPVLLRAITMLSPSAAANTVRLAWLADRTAVLQALEVVAESHLLIVDKLVHELGYEKALGTRGARYLPTITDRDGLSVHTWERIEAVTRACGAVLALNGGALTELERAGHEDRLRSALAIDPSLWAGLLPILLTSKVNERLLLTCSDLVGMGTAELKDALRHVPETWGLRVHAEGLGRLLWGDANLERESLRSFMTRVARLFVGRFAFPNPLAGPSSTWLSAPAVEAELRRQVHQAQIELGRELPGSLGRDEEAITSEAVREVCRALRQAAEQIEVVGQASNPLRIAVDLSHRQPTKAEEQHHSADLVFLLDADVREHVRGRWAEFVQVKKPAEAKGSFIDSWDVEVRQIRAILTTSESASYWFIDRYGVFHCVPAKVVLAWVEGTGRGTQKRARLGFNEIRGAGVPLCQFLIDLLTGGWLGSRSERALKIADGKANSLPRTVCKILVRSSSD